MSILKLTLGQSLNDLGLTVVVNIHNVSRLGEGKQNLVVGPGREYDIRLAPGQYVIETVLPSGQLITVGASLEDPSATQSVCMDLQTPADEWLRPLGLYRSASPEQYIAQLDSSLFFRRSKPVMEKIGAEIRSVLSPRPISCMLCGPVSSTKRVSPKFSRYGVEVYQVRTRNVDAYPADGLKRLFLFVEDENSRTHYCALPVPWKLADETKAQVEVLVDRGLRLEPLAAHPDYRITVIVHDRTLASLIGYLGGGNMPSAREILDKGVPKEMLFRKLSNPLAAAAGAYVLLATEADDNQYWREWIRNLMNWFRWLPDGAIQHGWSLLSRRDPSENDRKNARSSLMEGCRRGIPFFSRGVRLLLDGLVMLDSASGATDDEVAAALKEVWRLAVRTNMGEPFTSGYLSDERVRERREAEERREARSLTEKRRKEILKIRARERKLL